MLIEGLAARTVSNAGGPDPAGIARDLLAAHRGLGGVDVPALRDAVARLAEERPDLGDAVRREVAQRLSVTDQAVFERTPASKPLAVDDHRPASSLSELDSWEAGYREAVRENGGPFSNSPQLEAAFAADRQRLEANTAKANMETNKFLFVGLGAPMAAGLGGAVAPVAGTAVGEQFVSATAGRVAYHLTSSTVGGGTNVGLEAIKNGIGHMEGTTGAYVGAAASGALGATGLKLLGEHAPKLANNVALGIASGGGGE